MIQNIIYAFSGVIFILFLYIIYNYIVKPRRAHPEFLNMEMPEKFKAILQRRVPFYRKLNDAQREEFNKRTMAFLADKNISGIDTEITDEDRLIVAASAIIPMFAFPYYKYPNVTEILLYPNSFDHSFRTEKETTGRNILGMVGNGSLNGQVLLSKPDLEKAFDGHQHTQNVGIHEFVHLIDMADGVTDGVPEILMDHAYSMAWIKEIKKEIDRIEHENSDINPYALTNNAEFLAVVSEYFFSNPEKMKTNHPELYDYLVHIFHQQPVKHGAPIKQ